MKKTFLCTLTSILLFVPLFSFAVGNAILITYSLGEDLTNRYHMFQNFPLERFRFHPKWKVKFIKFAEFNDAIINQRGVRISCGDDAVSVALKKFFENNPALHKRFES